MEEVLITNLSKRINQEQYLLKKLNNLNMSVLGDLIVQYFNMFHKEQMINLIT